MVFTKILIQETHASVYLYHYPKIIVLKMSFELMQMSLRYIVFDKVIVMQSLLNLVPK